MQNKSLTLLLVAFTLSSCGLVKKNAAADSASKAPQEKASKTSGKKVYESGHVMFSVSDAELAKSKSGPHVIYFDTNSFELSKDAMATLKDEVLSEAKSSKTVKVVIEAHADERGSKSYNQRLSESRANAVKNYLVKNGVKVSKIKTLGFGETKPVALGHDEESWSKNRRAITISIRK